MQVLHRPPGRRLLVMLIAGATLSGCSALNESCNITPHPDDASLILLSCEGRWFGKE